MKYRVFSCFIFIILSCLVSIGNAQLSYGLSEQEYLEYGYLWSFQDSFREVASDPEVVIARDKTLDLEKNGDKLGERVTLEKLKEVDALWLSLVEKYSGKPLEQVLFRTYAFKTWEKYLDDWQYGPERQTSQVWRHLNDLKAKNAEYAISKADQFEGRDHLLTLRWLFRAFLELDIRFGPNDWHATYKVRYKSSDFERAALVLTRAGKLMTKMPHLEESSEGEMIKRYLARFPQMNNNSRGNALSLTGAVLEQASYYWIQVAKFEVLGSEKKDSEKVRFADQQSYQIAKLSMEQFYVQAAQYDLIEDGDTFESEVKNRLDQASLKVAAALSAKQAIHALFLLKYAQGISEDEYVSKKSTIEKPMFKSLKSAAKIYQELAKKGHQASWQLAAWVYEMAGNYSLNSDKKERILFYQNGLYCAQKAKEVNPGWYNANRNGRFTLTSSELLYNYYDLVEILSQSIRTLEMN